MVFHCVMGLKKGHHRFGSVQTMPANQSLTLSACAAAFCFSSAPLATASWIASCFEASLSAINCCRSCIIITQGVRLRVPGKQPEDLHKEALMHKLLQKPEPLQVLLQKHDSSQLRMQVQSRYQPLFMQATRQIMQSCCGQYGAVRCVQGARSLQSHS